MKNYRLLFTVFFIYSCSHSSLKTAEKLPAWFHHPSEYCSAWQICASAEGESLELAQNLARANLSSQLITQVSYHYENRAVLTSEDIDSQYSELAQRTVQSQSELVLAGVSVREQQKVDQSYYVLVSLDRQLMARRLREQMEQVDEKMKDFFEAKDRIFYTPLRTLFDEREQLASLYLVVQGSSFPRRYSLTELRAYRQQNPQHTFLIVDESSDEHQFLDGISARFSSSGHFVITRPSEKYDRKLIFRLEKEEQHLNVEGFVRYKLTANLIHQNPSGVELGKISLSSTTTGRSLVHCIEKAQNELVPQIEKKLLNLNL